MGQPEGMHLISERTEGHISSQILESMGIQKKVVKEELSGKMRCFACYDTSHSLDQCSIKYKLVPVTHRFGYATKFPFIMIQPLEHMLEKEIFYRHCVLITSNVSNLDLDTVKAELQKLWNLSCAWVLRRECSKSFLASFSTQGDVTRCLDNPSIKTLLDDEEVKLTVTRWTEGDDESNNLIKQWFLVCGVPRKYRAWTELYQVASAFGVLIDVDEGSLEVGDKEPIRLKIALRNQCGAPFSYHYVVGWSSRMVMLTVEATIDSENSSHSTRIITSTSTHVLDSGDSSDKEHRKEQNAAQSLLLEESTCIEESILDGKIEENQISTPADKVHTSKKTTIESSKAEGVQSVCRKTTTITAEDRFKGIPKPPIKNVYKRKGKKKQDTDEAINKSPSNKLDKVMGSESNNATRIGASEVECMRELNMEEIALKGVSKKSEEDGACREKEETGVTLAATTINSEKKIAEDSSKTNRTKFKDSTTTNGENRFKEIALLGVSKKSEENGACREKEETGVTLAATTINSEKKIAEDSSKIDRAKFKDSTTINGENRFKEIALMGVSKKSEEVGACREKEETGVTLAATTINSEKKTTEDSSKPDRAKFKDSTTINGENRFKEISLMGVSKKSEEVGACREKEETGVTLAVTTINSEKKTAEDSSKTDRAKVKDSTTINVENRFKGIPKPPVKHVYKRRGKKQQDTEAINKSPAEC